MNIRKSSTRGMVALGYRRVARTHVRGTALRMFQPRIALALLVLVLCGCSSSPAPGALPSMRGAVVRDVVYAAPEGVEVRLDLRLPKTRGPWPLVVTVHGGGWREGDKAFFDLSPFLPGYAVASINYRLYPAFRFPAMIEDVKSALRFLRAHAAEYGIDPDRVAIVGQSAGGHLAALAALADETAGWDVGENLGESSRVDAAVVLAGPSDLARTFPLEWVSDLVLGVFGVEQWPAGSPVTWADAGDPPLLVVHGEEDPIVPVEQARLLHEAVQAAGGDSTLVVVRNAGHAFESVGGTPSLTGSALVGVVREFLDRHLR
jgi:acetyl esterase/lipase